MIFLERTNCLVTAQNISVLLAIYSRLYIIGNLYCVSLVYMSAWDML